MAQNDPPMNLQESALKHMVNELMRSFSVDAFALGSLSAFFYYPYVLMQIPVGSLVDRFGPQRLLTIMSSLCALSCFIFASTHSLYIAHLSRMLMGFSGAFAFVGALKLATVWFKPSTLGLMAGLTQGLGMLGAAGGEGPLSMLVSVIGWRYTMHLLGFILLFIACAILVVTSLFSQRDNHVKTVATVHADTNSMWSGLRYILKSRVTWINACYVGMLFAPTAVFAELWGVSYIQYTYHISKIMAADAISFIFLGWAIGSPLIGALSDILGQRKPIMLFSALASLLTISVILYVHLSYISLLVVLFCYGVGNTGVAISYAVAGEYHPPQVSGISIAFTNMASVIFGAIMQPIVGAILDCHWQGRMLAGARLYSIHTYHMAMLALPLCSFLACIIWFFLPTIKSYHCHE